MEKQTNKHAVFCQLTSRLNKANSPTAGWSDGYLNNGGRGRDICFTEGLDSVQRHNIIITTHVWDTAVCRVWRLRETQHPWFGGVAPLIPHHLGYSSSHRARAGKCQALATEQKVPL